MPSHYTGIEAQYEGRRFCLKAEGAYDLVHLLQSEGFRNWLLGEEKMIRERKALTWKLYKE